MTKYAKEQPKDGDTVLHCGHTKGKPHQFFKLVDGMPFTAPNGESGVANWLIQCNKCFNKKPGDPTTVRGHSTWQGDEPAIKKKVLN